MSGSSQTSGIWSVNLTCDQLWKNAIGQYPNALPLQRTDITSSENTNINDLAAAKGWTEKDPTARFYVNLYGYDRTNGLVHKLNERVKLLLKQSTAIETIVTRAVGALSQVAPSTTGAASTSYQAVLNSFCDPLITEPRLMSARNAALDALRPLRNNVESLSNALESLLRTQPVTTSAADSPGLDFLINLLKNASEDSKLNDLLHVGLRPILDEYQADLRARNTFERVIEARRLDTFTQGTLRRIMITESPLKPDTTAKALKKLFPEYIDSSKDMRVGDNTIFPNLPSWIKEKVSGAMKTVGVSLWMVPSKPLSQIREDLYYNPYLSLGVFDDGPLLYWQNTISVSNADGVQYFKYHAAVIYLCLTLRGLWAQEDFVEPRLQSLTRFTNAFTRSMRSMRWLILVLMDLKNGLIQLNAVNKQLLVTSRNLYANILIGDVADMAADWTVITQGVASLREISQRLVTMDDAYRSREAHSGQIRNVPANGSVKAESKGRLRQNDLVLCGISAIDAMAKTVFRATRIGNAEMPPFYQGQNLQLVESSWLAFPKDSNRSVQSGDLFQPFVPKGSISENMKPWAGSGSQSTAPEIPGYTFETTTYKFQPPFEEVPGFVCWIIDVGGDISSHTNIGLNHTVFVEPLTVDRFGFSLRALINIGGDRSVNASQNLRVGWFAYSKVPVLGQARVYASMQKLSRSLAKQQDMVTTAPHEGLYFSYPERYFQSPPMLMTCLSGLNWPRWKNARVEIQKIWESRNGVRLMPTDGGDAWVEDVWVTVVAIEASLSEMKANS